MTDPRPTLRDLTEKENEAVSGGVIITGHNGNGNGGNGNRASNNDSLNGFNGSFSGGNTVRT
jgi:hypothetical protein